MFIKLGTSYWNLLDLVAADTHEVVDGGGNTTYLIRLYFDRHGITIPFDGSFPSYSTSVEAQNVLKRVMEAAGFVDTDIMQ